MGTSGTLKGWAGSSVIERIMERSVVGDMTKRQLLTTLKTVPEELKTSVVCAMIGHSKIISLCFGYVKCARCDAQIDQFGSVFDTTDSVIMRHNCEICQENFKKLGWKDLYLCPDPFAVEDVEAQHHQRYRLDRHGLPCVKQWAIKPK